MQIIFENEDEGEFGKEASTVGIVICVGGIGRCMEGECDGETRGREGRI